MTVVLAVCGVCSAKSCGYLNTHSTSLQCVVACILVPIPHIVLANEHVVSMSIELILGWGQSRLSRSGAIKVVSKLGVQGCHGVFHKVTPDVDLETVCQVGEMSHREDRNAYSFDYFIAISDLSHSVPIAYNCVLSIYT